MATDPVTSSEFFGQGPSFVEHHFSLEQIAVMWNISKETVRRLFENEADVLVVGNAVPRLGKRKYRTLRVPAHVVERVRKRLLQAKAS